MDFELSCTISITKGFTYAPCEPRQHQRSSSDFQYILNPNLFRMCVRLSRVCMEECIKYALKRKTFGKVRAYTPKNQTIYLYSFDVVATYAASAIYENKIVNSDILQALHEHQAIRMKVIRQRRRCTMWRQIIFVILANSIQSFRGSTFHFPQIASMARRIECLQAWLESLVCV
jgi:hypothetical protein